MWAAPREGCDLAAGSSLQPGAILEGRRPWEPPATNPPGPGRGSHAAPIPGRGVVLLNIVVIIGWWWDGMGPFTS